GITNGIKNSQIFAGVLKAVGEVLRRLMGLFKELADAAGRFLEAIGSKGLIQALKDLAGDIGKAVLQILSDIGEKLDSYGPLGVIAKDALLLLGSVLVLQTLAGVTTAVKGLALALLAVSAPVAI